MSTMRTYGYYTASMTSAGTLTSAVDLGEESYNRIVIGVPTMTSATDIYLHGSADGTTYRRAYQSIATACVIGSAISQANVELPNYHFRYLKVEHTTACTATSHVYQILIS